MRKKNTIKIIGLLMCLTFIQILPVRGEDYILTDPTGDVYLYSSTDLISMSVTEYGEIDIESLTIDGETITLELVSTPIWDNERTYKCLIYWVGDDVLGNYTKCYWGDDFNKVVTRIHTSDQTIITSHTITDTITVVGSSLVMPIENVSLIPEVLDPGYLAVTTEYRISNDELYTDTLTNLKGGLPGFTIWIAFISMSSITLLTLVIKRKKC